MRRVLAVVVATLAMGALTASQSVADSVEVKGPHICCKQCVNVVGKILGGVEGVSDAKCDIKSKTVSFTAKDEAAAKAGVKHSSRQLQRQRHARRQRTQDSPGRGGEGRQLDKVTIKGVHVCCGMCETAINNVFKIQPWIWQEGCSTHHHISGGELYAVPSWKPSQSRLQRYA